MGALKLRRIAVYYRRDMLTDKNAQRNYITTMGSTFENGIIDIFLVRIPLGNAEIR